MDTCKHDWQFVHGTSTLKCQRCGAGTGPTPPEQLAERMMQDVLTIGRAVKTRHEGKPVHVAKQPAQKRPQNCGTSYCSCIECVMEPAQQEIDWKDQYEKQKRRADMWVAKYEADIGPLEKAGPVAAQQEPVAEIVSGVGGCLSTQLSDKWTPNLGDKLYTTPPAQQEPVAWYRDEDGIRMYYDTKYWADSTPLYTSQPQRTWVGLTDEDINDLVKEFDGLPITLSYAIEAKLKEKNT